MRKMCSKLAIWFAKKIKRKTTGFMLNHITLSISNLEVAKKFENHQALQSDRLLKPGVLITGIYLIFSIVHANTDSGPWIAVVNNACMFGLLMLFQIFRIYNKDKNSYHGYIVIAFFAVHVILCTLSNSNHLPEYLEGPGIN